ncbi:MAG: sulfate adenylyltransferase, partial [Deltaproteobacteria bacterium]|nr:sulfate adenylyltransferase [Deltaproteobacteria bacterium]
MKRDSLIAPHGGELVNRLALRENFLPQPSAKTLPISNIEFSDLYMIATGALSPLKGFMGNAGYDSILEKMRLESGLPWAIPITLAASEGGAGGIMAGDTAYLTYNNGGENTCVGEIAVRETFKRDKRREALAVYKTDDEKHPGVAMLNRHGEYLVGGDIVLYKEPPFTVDGSYYLTPGDCRKKFLELGWRRIVGFP